MNTIVCNNNNSLFLCLTLFFVNIQKSELCLMTFWRIIFDRRIVNSILWERMSPTRVERHGTVASRGAWAWISNKYKNKLCNISNIAYNGNTKHTLKYKEFWQAKHLSTISYMHLITQFNSLRGLYMCTTAKQICSFLNYTKTIHRTTFTLLGKTKYISTDTQPSLFGYF